MKVWLAVAVLVGLLAGPAFGQRPSPRGSPGRVVSSSPSPSPVNRSSRDDGLAALVLALVFGGAFVVGLVVYLAPVFVAGFRRHPNLGPILIINLLLGWTFIGWVVALVWSVSAKREN